MRFDFMDAVFGLFVFSFFSLVGGLLFTLVGLGIYEVTGIPCNTKSQMIGFESQFTIATGCMVKVNDKQWIPYSDLIPLERDGKIVYVPKYKNRMELEVK